MKTLILAVLFFGATVPFEAVAQDLSAGEKLYKRVCRTCHGPTAKGVSSYPKLIGHSGAYLAERLERYRAREKIGPNSPLMWPAAAKLSDEDIANLVAVITGTFSE